MKMAASSASKSTALFACSKCFSRHPFEELSQGQQLCKECRGSFPVVKCTYCRSEFQQESKNSISSICKRCVANVEKYGKPSSCQHCSIIAAFVNGKCQRCHDSYRRYGPPKTCEQCKQKCAFEKEDKKQVDGKVLCWLCSLSYKRALVRTKQCDPARHSRVFRTAEKDKEKRERKERDKYFNHKKPQRPDVTKMGNNSASSTLDEPLIKMAKIESSKKRERDNNDTTDHVGEITQLKEKIASMQKTISAKNQELVTKQAAMTAMKAKLFNEEQLIKVKMKNMSKVHEEKVADLQLKINALQTELSRVRRETSKPRPGNKRGELFPGANKKDLISTSAYRPVTTAPPLSRSDRRKRQLQDDPRGGSNGSSGSRSQSTSPEPPSRRSQSNSRSGSPVVATAVEEDQRHGLQNYENSPMSLTSSTSPHLVDKERHEENPQQDENGWMEQQEGQGVHPHDEDAVRREDNQTLSRGPSFSSRSASRSPSRSSSSSRSSSPSSTGFHRSVSPSSSP